MTKIANIVVSAAVAAASLWSMTAQAQSTVSKYEVDGKGCHIKFSIELPRSNDAASQAIRWALVDELDEFAALNMEMDRIVPKFSPTSKMGWDKVAAYYGNRLLEIEGNVKQEREELPFGYQMTIAKLDEGPQWVTYSCGHHRYTGGAHGYGNTRVMTFNRQSGEAFTSFIDESSTVAMQPLLEDVLWQYLINGGAASSKTGDLRQYMLIQENEPIPLARSIYPSKKGIVLHYGTYEIMPYAAGEPEIVIEWSKVMPYLTNEAREFLGK